LNKIKKSNYTMEEKNKEEEIENIKNQIEILQSKLSKIQKRVKIDKMSSEVVLLN
jgi:hypothetical protein